ncbi:hypothetical protein F4861DRAFT_538988 [Xylaria intraflava]|nr:hypothetical protein F4861DRAFT_538988 [Xylaria intraflava]
MAEMKIPADRAGHQIPLPVMGMTQKEYQAAFILTPADKRENKTNSSYLDDANLLREMEELDRKRRGLTVLEIPHVSWYNRPECWALILGAIGLANALFTQWLWPYIRVNPTLSAAADGGEL